MQQCNIGAELFSTQWVSVMHISQKWPCSLKGSFSLCLPSSALIVGNFLPQLIYSGQPFLSFSSLYLCILHLFALPTMLIAFSCWELNPSEPGTTQERVPSIYSLSILCYWPNIYVVGCQPHFILTIWSGKQKCGYICFYTVLLIFFLSLK